MNKDIILNANSEFERQRELTSLLSSHLSEDQKKILRLCTTRDHNSIGIIGVLLDEKDDINLCRLLIIASKKSPSDISKKAEETLSQYSLVDLVARTANMDEASKKEVDNIIVEELFNCDLDF